MPGLFSKEQGILNSVSDGVTVNSQGVFVYVNEIFAKMVGYSVTELIGMSAYDLIAPDYVDVIKERAQSRQQGKDIVSVYEIELERRDGSRFPVEISVTRIVYEGKSSSLTVTRDITYRKETEQRFENILTLAPVAIMTYAITGHITSCNQATSDLTGYRNEELVGKHLTQLPFFTFETVKMMLKLLASIIRGQEIGPVDFPYTSKTGENRFARAYPRMITSSSGKREILAVIEDTTESTRLLNSLRESESQWRGLSENSPDHVLLLGRDLKIRYANYSSPGLTVEDLIGSSILDYLQDERKEEIKEILEGVLESGDVASYETRYDIPGDLPLFYESRVVPQVVEKEITGIILSARDISERKQAEKRLRASEDLFRGFMQSATDAFTIFDNDLRFVEVNDTWLQLTGHKKENVIGKNILEIYSGLEETRRYDAYLRVLETGEPVEFRGVVTNVGPGLIFDVSAFKTGDSLGVVARDVTGRMRYETRLESLHGHAVALASAETMAEVADITRDSLNEVIDFHVGSLGFVEGESLSFQYVWNWDIPELYAVPLNGSGITVLAVNSGLTQNIGDVRSNSLFMDWSEIKNTVSELAVPIIVSDEAVGVVNLESEMVNYFSLHDQRLVETLASHIAAAYSKIKYLDRLNALHGLTVELGYTESVEDIVKITWEIMRKALGFQFASFHIMEKGHLITLGGIGDPTISIPIPLSGKGITTKAAREAHAVLVGDVSLDSDFLKGFFESGSELAVPIIVDNDVLGVLNVQSLKLDAFSDEDTRLLELLASNVGSALHRLYAAEEKSILEYQLLSERVRAEQEQELNQLKTRFLSTAAHELRTPLTSIKGYIDIVENAQFLLPPKLKEYKKVVSRNVDRLTRLTGDLLDQQRLEEGRMTTNFEPVYIKDLLKDIVIEFTPLLADKNQTLQCNSVETTVHMDKLRMMQVLVNLLSNASKFSPEGSDILVEVVEVDGVLRCSVVDQGVGICEEDRGKLFTPFPGILVEGNVKGTGLGLSISKGIIELHGGKIWAESDGEGKGSTITFTLPLEQKKGV